jgi:NhaA family Na+:H+ antiporter
VRTLFSRSPWTGSAGVAEALRTETVGGVLVLAAAALALVWANTPWQDGYAALLGTTFGPEALHLDLTLREWTADGLLAIFFLVVGIELKQEFLEGDLRDPAKALVPVLAAACGVVVPAAIYLAITWSDPAARVGWAVPVATDIAFALAVLAVAGRGLPAALRVFLLTLAVVDDLIAIVIIAVGYTDHLEPAALGAAALALAAFTVAARTRLARWWVLIPLGVVTWAFVHASGVHATVAGVLCGLAMPLPLAGRVEHRARPLSAGVAVPLFAFGAAGVALDPGSLRTAADDVVVPAIVVALVVGKVIGVFGGTWLLARFTRARLDEGLAWSDVVAVSLLAGIGFTVALLVGDLSFGAETPRGEHARLAVLTASLLAAVLATIMLRRRNAAYRAAAAASITDPAGRRLSGAHARRGVIDGG